MTVKLSVSVPDDIAAWLATQGNVSGAIADAVRHKIGDEELRRARRREAARQYGEWYAREIVTNPEFAADITELDRQTYEMSSWGMDW